MDISVERGFTSLPKSFFRELPEDLTHGARLALAILCEHADAVTGTCSLCYRTLGDILRRSKASISAYIRELRQHGLVVTEQTNRFGYKGPCIFTLPFYKSFRAALSRRKAGAPCPIEADQTEARATPDQPSNTDQITEHRVQPSEHSNTNQNLDNNITAPPTDQGSPADRGEPSESSGELNLLREWQQLDHGAPYPSFSQLPSPELVQKTSDAIHAEVIPDETKDVSDEVIRDELHRTWVELGVRPTQKEVVVQAKIFRDVVGSGGDTFPLLAETIRDSWKPHWKRPSTPKQFRELLRGISAKASPRSSSIRQLLEQYLRRHERVYGSTHCCVGWQNDLNRSSVEL